MNRVLAQVLLVLGVIVFAFGGYQFATNQPKTFTATQDQSLGGALNNLGNAFSTPLENMKRESNRKSATGMMVFGGIVGLVGIVGLSSSKKAN